MEVKVLKHDYKLGTLAINDEGIKRGTKWEDIDATRVMVRMRDNQLDDSIWEASLESNDINGEVYMMKRLIKEGK